jgi:hypothetical protein
MKTSELIGSDLNIATAMSLGREVVELRTSLGGSFSQGKRWAMIVEGRACVIPDYAHDPAAAYPVIVDHAISIIRCDDDYGTDAKGFCNNVRIPVWAAAVGQQSIETSTEHQHHDAMFQIDETNVAYGPTLLVAAMRAFVRLKLGEEVELP